jgi:CheY-like chemotaxis protein
VIAALCTDLFFAARIAEVAKTLGVVCVGARDLDGLLARLGDETPTVTFVDMRLRGGDAAEAIRRLRALKATRVVAFLPHVEEDLAEAARAAGADTVLTHGQLGKKLPSLIAAD